MMEKMSICLISDAYFPMQGVTDLFNISKSLVSLGNCVYVVVCKRENEKQLEMINGINIIRMPIKVPSPTDLFGRLIFYYYVTMTLLQLIQTKNIKIVHMYGCYGSLPILFLVKIIKYTHSVKWFYSIRSRSVNKNPFFRTLFNTLLAIESKFYDGIFIISSSIKYLVNNPNVFLEPIGVDFELFNNKKNRSILSQYGIKDDDIVLIYIGSLSINRKIDVLIEAFYYASLKVKNLWLVLLGEGSDITRLKLLTIKLGISNRTLFLGYMDYKKIPTYLSSSDIGISYIPNTDYYDSQPPLKTIEYLACSLPVIATKTKGNKLYVKNKKNGLLSDDDSISLSKAIIRLSIDSSLRYVLSENARKSVYKYDINNIVKNYLMPYYLTVYYSSYVYLK